MIEFYRQKDFYNWLPINKDKLLEYCGVTQEEFYERYMIDSIVQLDSEDIRDLMEILIEVNKDNK